MFLKKISFSLFLFLFSSKIFAADFQHGISFFGDLKYPKNFKHFHYVNPNTPKGGQIKYASEGTFNNLNPFILKGIAPAAMNLVFDSLMESSDDEIYSKYGLIAQAVKLSDDRKSITFKLRPAARFHDGSKLTADDVIFSFNTLKEKGHPTYAMIYRDILNAKKINDYQVQFSFKNADNRELPLLIASLPVFSKKYFSQNEFDKTTLESPLGSGPYRLKKIDAGKSITLERAPNYWAKDLPINVGRYNFDEITYEFYRDNNVLVEAFKAGAYDFRQENIARNWANAYNIPKVESGEIIKKEIKHDLPAPMQCFVFNLRREKFQNLNLRKAIALSFDFEWVKDKIFYGSYTRTSSFFDNSQFASTGLPRKAELKILNRFKGQIPDSVFNEEFKMPKTDGSGFARENLTKAWKLLEEAGYFMKNGRLIDPKTEKPVEIEFLVSGKAFYMVIAPMIKNLAVLGIKAKTRLVQENQYLNRLKTHDFDMIVHVFSSGMVPSDEQFAYWHSSQSNVIGGNNFAGVKNAAVDYLVEKISSAKSREELQIFTKSLDRILLNSYFVIPQWYSSHHRILYQNKFAMPKKAPPYSLGLDTWWKKQN